MNSDHNSFLQRLNQFRMWRKSDTFEDMNIILSKPQKWDENCLYDVVI